MLQKLKAKFQQREKDKMAHKSAKYGRGCDSVILRQPFAANFRLTHLLTNHKR